MKELSKLPFFDGKFHGFNLRYCISCSAIFLKVGPATRNDVRAPFRVSWTLRNTTTLGSFAVRIPAKLKTYDPSFR